MSGAENSHKDDGIRELLKNYRPSQLDEAVKTVCPFYEPRDREFTSVYLEFHELSKTSILTGLQLRLEELQVVSEEELGSGRVDGSVYRPAVNGGKIMLYGGEQPVAHVALLEVKTGKNVKILQSAAYAYTSKVPVILAEVPVAEVHLVDCETSVRLLNWARRQLDRLKKLRAMDRRIPDGYRCRSCANDSCPYWQDDGRRKSAFLLKERVEQLDGKLAEIVEGMVSVVEGLIERQGFFVEGLQAHTLDEHHAKTGRR